MPMTVAQALLKAEQLEQTGVITPLALALIVLAKEFQNLVGGETYCQLIEDHLKAEKRK
jgi:hypothetical protein